MAVGDEDDVIDEAVVEIGTALEKGFIKKLQAKVDRAVKDVTAPVKLVADATGFARSARSVLKAHLAANPLEVKVRLVADATGFNTSANRAIKAYAGSRRQLEYKVKLVADTSGLDATIGKAGTRAGSSARATGKKVGRAVSEGIADGLDDPQIFKTIEGTDRRLADSINKRIQKSLSDSFLLTGESSKIKGAADQLADAQRRLSEVAERESARRVLAAERESAKTVAAWKKISSGPNVIDFGGKGIRPMNLLYATIAALTPALFAMGSSALQASTSVAALGAAGIGAALGITGLALAFSDLSDLLALRKTAKAEAAADAANAAAQASQNALQELQARNNVTDAIYDEVKAERELHDARVQAARDLANLRQKVRELQDQEREDQLSVEEAQLAQQRTARNFFATSLMQRRATQDVASARTRLAGTRLEKSQDQADLKDSIRKGVQGSDKVRDQRDALRRARNRVAETRLAQSQQAMAGTTGKTSSAVANLNEKLAAASPALRDLYDWIDANEKRMDAWRRQLQQAFLPGFTQFLDKIGEKPNPGSVSTLQLFTDEASRLGRILSKYVGLLGEWTQSPFFRSRFRKIGEDNAEALDITGQAGQKLADALLRIIAAASPLNVRFMRGLDRFATWFDNIITKADRDGSLAKWFDDAGDAMGKWIDIGKNVAVLLGNILKASNPTGTSLVERFEVFTENLAKWSGSAEGQKELTQFFDFFKNLNYREIGQLIAQMSTAFLAWHTMSFLWAKPLALVFGALTTYAASHPDEAAAALEAFNTALGSLLAVVKNNPEAASQLLLVLAGLKALSIAKPIKFSLPALAVPALQVAGLMTVTALTVSAVTGKSIPELLNDNFNVPEKAERTVEQQQNPDTILGGAVDKWLDKQLANLGYLTRHWFAITLPNSLNWSIGQGGWSGFGRNMQHWWSITLPNSLNLGIGEGGWSGLGSNLGRWVTETLPEWLSGGQAHSWSEMGTVVWREVRDFVGLNIPLGLWDGIDLGKNTLWENIRQFFSNFWEHIKKLCGIQSPSTVAASIGKNIIDGLWLGITSTWDALLTTVTNWVDTNFLDPLLDKFSTAGSAIRDAFVAAFGGLTAKLAAPVNAAMTWLNAHLIAPLNVLLGALGITAIDPIRMGAVAAPATGVGAGLGAVVGGVLSRADGGHVPGFSPHSRADNIPAMLTAGEWVQPVDAVRHYGPEFMESVRTKQFPKYASGGAVGGLKAAQGSNLATEIITAPLKGLGLQDLVNMVVAKASSFFGGIGGGQATGDVNVAETAEATARTMGATDKQLVALISAGIVESNLTNLKRAVDHDSLGFLQQRPSQGWGSPEQITNVAYATRKFIEAARRMDVAGISAGELAARVQRPAAQYRGRYAEREADAVAVLNRNTPLLNGYGDAEGGGAGTPGVATYASLVAFGRWLQQRGYDVSEHPAFGGVTRGGHARNSRHYRGRALDINHGAGTSPEEQRWLKMIIPEAHRRGFRSIFMSPTLGHYDHAHIDFNAGGPVPAKVPARKYDTGGTLPPGYTLAFNGTGRNETIRTHSQEKALAGPVRLDRRDLALLAAHIAGATSPTIQMDGRKVAEVANAYTYMPAGV